MINITLQGGLGNQMFQYALGRHLQNQGKEVCYNKRNLLGDAETHELGQAQYGLHTLQTRGMSFQEPDKDARWIVDPTLRFNEAAYDAPDGVVLHGCWQSEKYFEEISAQLMQEFLPAVQPSAEICAKANELDATNSIVLQIRRGDYTAPAMQNYHGLMDAEYFQEAFDYIRANTPEGGKVYGITDDSKWLANAFPGVENISTGSRANDIFLMSRARNIVISNSTFGWWGAWLGDKLDDRSRIVVAPSRWFVTPMLDAQDIVPDRWIKMGPPAVQQQLVQLSAGLPDAKADFEAAAERERKFNADRIASAQLFRKNHPRR